MRKIFSIFGPTGIGKSSLAIELAKKINGEIIGVDSRQIYKGIPIGTAQPNASQLNEIPHHQIGFKKLNEKISAGEYIKLIDDKNDITEVHSTIYVNRKSQKQIVIGSGGDVLKQIGKEARKEMEEELDRKVFLKTWVKVKKNWNTDSGFIQSLGVGGNYESK